MPTNNLDNVPEPPWSDALGHLRNEMDYQKQVGSKTGAAALEYALAEIARLRGDVMSIVQTEVHRAEAMGGNEDYPKEYIDGRYRTAIEILGGIRKLFGVTDRPVVPPTTPPTLHVGQRVRLVNNPTLIGTLNLHLVGKVMTVKSLHTLGDNAVFVIAQWGDQPGDVVDMHESAFERAVGDKQEV